MARIAGVNIPANKRVTISLRYIYGIGPSKAQQICQALSIPDDRRVNQLTVSVSQMLYDFGKVSSEVDRARAGRTVGERV